MKTQITYLGGATYLLEIGAFRLLTDPGFDPNGTEKSVVYGAEKAQWSEAYFQKAQWLIEHIVYGRDHRPYLTHLFALVEKR